MLLNKRKGTPKFRRGETVRVKDKNSILLSLDRSHMLDGILFMEQMWDYCGNKYIVTRAINSLFDEHRKRTFRLKAPMYILDNLSCEGQSDAFSFTCDRTCFLFWHEDWLGEDTIIALSSESQESESRSTCERIAACQLQVINQMGRDNSWLNDKLQYSIRKFRYLKRTILQKMRSVDQSNQNVQNNQEHLQSGDRVRVCSKDQIRKILDKSRKTYGCTFQLEMYDHCGKEFQVFKKVDHFYDETKQKICKCRNIYLLEGSYCNGKATYWRRCDRNCYFFWQRNWLEKV